MLAEGISVSSPISVAFSIDWQTSIRLFPFVFYARVQERSCGRPASCSDLTEVGQLSSGSRQMSAWERNWHEHGSSKCCRTIRTHFRKIGSQPSRPGRLVGPLSVGNSSLGIPSSLVPSPSSGRFSDTNERVPPASTPPPSASSLQSPASIPAVARRLFRWKRQRGGRGVAG